MNQKGGSRTETLVKLVLIFVISLLSFSVGTFVGKQFSDSQHKMANLEDEFHGNRSTASTEKHGGEEHALTDADIASLTEEFVNAERETVGHHGDHGDSDDHGDNGDGHADHDGDNHSAPATAHKEDHAKPAHKDSHVKEKAKAAHTTAKAHEDVVAKAAHRVAEDKSPSKKEMNEKRTPSSLPTQVAADTVGKYTVQVASYSTEKEAQDHAQKLVNSGLNAFYLPAVIKGTTWYRVSVGIFSDRKAANDYKASLVKQAKVGSAIVQKVVQ